MNMLELATLSLPQRLQAMEVLWESLTRDAAYDPSPAWHADVLSERVREIDAGTATDWAQAKTRILANAAQIKEGRNA